MVVRNFPIQGTTIELADLKSYLHLQNRVRKMMMKYTIVKSNDSWKAIFHLYPVTHDDGLQKAHSEEWVWCGCGLTVGYQEVASFLQKKGYGGIFFAAEDKLASYKVY